MTRNRLIALGAVVFIGALVWNAPAALMLAWFKPASASLQLYGAEGTLGSGRVAGIQVAGKPVWQALDWRWNPLGLLAGRAVFNLDSTSPVALQTRVSTTPLGTTRLHDLHVDGDLRTLLGAVGQGFLPVAGNLLGDIASLTLKGRALTAATGELTLQSLSWTLAKDPLLLGDFKATSETVDDGVLITLESISGPLQVGGTIKLAADQSYVMDLSVKAKPEANQMLQTMVQSLGQVDAQRNYHLRRQGKLI